LRNKASHLGQPVFRTMSFHDKAGKFYEFIPRQWPYIWERRIAPHGGPRDPHLAQRFQEELIHMDIVSFSQSLRLKVTEVVRTATAVISQAYDQFKDFPFNQAALSELQSNSEAYTFESFIQP
jgi:hypothetical protein